MLCVYADKTTADQLAKWPTNQQPTHKETLKAAVLQMLKKIKNEKIKLTVNTGPVRFSGGIYYYWPLTSVDKIVGKTLLFFA